jgi:hypothetical protein
MSYLRSAWVTITGKVFVDDTEVQELLAKGKATLLSENDTDIKSEADAFEFLAHEKMREAFASDEPVKFASKEIDMSSFA